MTQPALEPGSTPSTTSELLSRLLLTREQVGELLGVPPKTVDYLHRMRQLRAVKVGKFCMWKPETVRRYVGTLEPEK